MSRAADRGRSPGGAAAGGPGPRGRPSRRPPLLLATLVALAVLVQTALAPVLGLAAHRQGGAPGADAAPAPLLAALCGPGGPGSAAAAENDAAPDPSSPPGRRGEEGCCLACHALPQPPGLPVPAESALPGAALRPLGLAWVPNPAAASPPRPPLRPGAPRAPPLLRS